MTSLLPRAFKNSSWLSWLSSTYFPVNAMLKQKLCCRLNQQLTPFYMALCCFHFMQMFGQDYHVFPHFDQINLSCVSNGLSQVFPVIRPDKKIENIKAECFPYPFTCSFTFIFYLSWIWTQHNHRDSFAPQCNAHNFFNLKKKIRG